jgi:SAM-dependent methyltransferase
MKRKSEWQPTKFRFSRGRWRGARDNGPSSKLMADLQVQAYEKAIVKYASGNLVDLGCGNAPLCGIYKSLVKNYTWVDWPHSRHQQFQIDVEADLSGVIPFLDEQFDTILLSDVLEHVSNPDLLFSEMARIVRPGGFLIVGVPFMYLIHEEPFDYFRYTEFSLRQFAQKHGLNVIEIKPVGGGLDVLVDISGKILGAAWSPLALVPYYLWSSLRRIPLFRSVNTRSARRFPLAYVAVYSREP